MEAEDDWESSSGEVTDTDQFNDEDIYSTSASLCKLQFRFLAEIGALLVMDENDECLSLKDIYRKIAEEKNGCCWELFEVYRHLKSLGYIIGHHSVPWSMKGVDNNGAVDTEVNGITCVVQMLSNLQVDELRPNFDVYLPNSKFRKSSPGDPTFLLCLVRRSPPSSAKSEALGRQCGGIPLKFCHVDHGRVSFFTFKLQDRGAPFPTLNFRTDALLEASPADNGMPSINEICTGLRVLWLRDIRLLCKSFSEQKLYSMWR